MRGRLLLRIESLEFALIPKTLLVLQCVTSPTDNQLEQMEKAHKQGRMAILTIFEGDVIWLYGQPRPWLNET